MSALNNTHIEPASPPDDVIQELSVDSLIFGLDQGRLDVLLIRHELGKAGREWALPGGWVRRSEDLRCAAERILAEHTGMQGLFLEQLKTFGRVDRFPNERVITVAYYALVSTEQYPLISTSGHSNAQWFPLSEVPQLVYDHNEILQYGLETLRHKVRFAPIGFNLLPERFTLLQLQSLYEAILDCQLDKSNFRRKFLKMGLLVPCDESQTGVAHRAAKLYRFDREVYASLVEQGYSFEF